MDESIKERPIRAYYDSGMRSYYIYNGGAKRRIRVKRSQKLEDVQKDLNKSSRVIMNLKRVPITQQRPNILDQYKKTTQLEYASEILKPEDYDEGLKQQKKIRADEKELLRDIRTKLKSGFALTTDEKKLLPLLSADISKQEIKQDYDISITPDEEKDILTRAGRSAKLANQLRRRLVIDKILTHHNIPLGRYSFDAWNGLNNGKMVYILILKDFIDLIHSLDKDDLYKLLTSGGSRLFRVSTAMDKAQLIDNVLNYISRSPTNYAIFSSNPLNTDIKNYKLKSVQTTEAKQIGTGKLPSLYNDEIEAFFNNEKKFPNFGGVIAADEIHKLPKHLPIGFIMNLDKSSGPGTHWVSVYINNNAIYYYDPFGEDPSSSFKKDIHKYLTDMKIPVMLKLKVNKIQDQDTRSHRCGYFAIKFLDDIMMSDGKSWKFTTRYIGDEPINNSKEGEGKIKKEFEYI
jgi:hypothetical protein